MISNTDPIVCIYSIAYIRVKGYDVMTFVATRFKALGEFTYL